MEHVTLFPTNMKISTLISNPKNKRYLFVAVIIIILLVPFLLIKLFSKTQAPLPLTTPIIPTSTPTGVKVTTPLDTTNPHNPEQKLVFNWGTLSPALPSTIKNYIISSPLINPSTINNAANRLGFTALDKSRDTSETSYLWLKDKISFFGSPKQNQIFFTSSIEVPKNSGVISINEATGIASNIVSNLFGETLLTTLSSTPEVRYLDLQPRVEEEPLDTAPGTANIININFQQNIDSLPLLSLSKRGETISVTIDTTKKLYLLSVHGGYLTLKEDKSSELLTFSDLKSIAPSQALRISQSKDIPSEAAFTKSRSINVAVKSVSLGYFQRADNSLFPVFIINGNMSAKGLEEFPAIYIVPATK